MIKVRHYPCTDRGGDGLLRAHSRGGPLAALT
jgi:hypothetical protein